MLPRKVRRTLTFCPVPWQSGQVTTVDPAAAPEPPHAEERAEQVAHVEPAGGAAAEQVVQVDVLVAARAAPSGRATADAAIGVVLLLLGRVGQHVVRVVDLLESLLGICGLVHVGVQLARLATEGLLDLIGARRALHTECFVVVTGTCGH